MRMKCSNCEQDAPLESSLVVYPTALERPPAAVICKVCQTNVLTMKIVLHREDVTKPFEYEGYLPISSVK
jgi:hypothetical protein